MLVAFFLRIEIRVRYRFIEWCLTQFQRYFSYIAADSAPIHAFLEFFNQLSAQYSFKATGCFSHTTIFEIMDSGERGMNPVAITIINPRKEYWPSRGLNQQSPVLMSATLPTDLWARRKELGLAWWDH